MSRRMAANDNKRTLPSQRNPLAALANVNDWLAEQEPNELLRAYRRRRSALLRQLAQQEPPPNPQPPQKPHAA